MRLDRGHVERRTGRARGDHRLPQRAELRLVKLLVGEQPASDGERIGIEHARAQDGALHVGE